MRDRLSGCLGFDMSTADLELVAGLEFRTSAAAVAEAGCIEVAWEHTVPVLERIEVLTGR